MPVTNVLSLSSPSKKSSHGTAYAYRYAWILRTRRLYGPALANLDRMDEAYDAIEEALKAKPDLSLTYLKETLPTKEPNGLAPYLDGLRKAGLAD